MPSRSDITRRITTSTPVKGIIRKSKTVFIPGFAGHSLHAVWPAFLRQLNRANLVERTAAISFNVFMAIPPTLIFIFTLVPLLPISDKFIQELFSVIRDIVPGEQNNRVIIDFLADFLNNPRNELLSFGLLLAVFFSSNAMMGILRSFDENYEGFYKRSGLGMRQTALQMTLVTLLLVFMSLLLLVAHEAVLQWLGVQNHMVRLLIVNLRWVILVALIFYVISFIYRHGPALHQKWPLITPGSVLATTLVILTTILVSYYINNFSNYNKLYGSISVVFIIMSLIYANALVILLGFELNVTLAALQQKKRKEQEAIAAVNV
ncbi:YihY/virulence factor BrkB family protein [Paracnuella aquatica]|uniref:YihY/virulence factor BrkB family protein n=1 Tax=Paracnuella aquatica TaxID=2268757 RepID=UPI000DF01191|nr:YihY/virulence factor BrkB family protein [Paracnuella aquatica]RPD51426.1 YihY/virulence factor BrkB family protein [Paracnuella aquatica]